jgi:hypothetical protein
LLAGKVRHYKSPNIEPPNTPNLNGNKFGQGFGCFDGNFWEQAALDFASKHAAISE